MKHYRVLVTVESFFRSREMLLILNTLVFIFLGRFSCIGDIRCPYFQ